MHYEMCRDNLELLAADYANLGRNEATTRLQLIDRLFFECLGWDRSECTSEESHGKEYTDYSFFTTQRVLIVEAKNEGDYFELPAGEERREYSIPSLCRDYQNLKRAIFQVAAYCQSRGTPIGCVCNGHQLVAFLAARSDGQPPLEGRALVFPSYAAMSRCFKELWDGLSKSGIIEGRLASRLLGQPLSPIPFKLSSRIANYPGFKQRNPFQTDLQVLSELVLEDVALSTEVAEEFLRECYCRSGALSQYALVSKEMLRARYAALFNESSPAPTTVPIETRNGLTPDVLAESLSRRPIILIGDMGVGKTTFIRHLIAVEASEVFDNAITLYLDLGARATLTADLRSFVIDEMARQLRDDHKINVEEYNFVRGVYHRQLEVFQAGIYSKLRETNSERYNEKESERLEELVGKRDEHLRHSFEHISKARRKQIVMFLDNADQRSEEDQQRAFLIAQELADSWQATVFLSLRPETFHRSMQKGTLSGYHAKAFSISPPRIDQVITKRIDFALKIASGRLPISGISDKIKVSLENLTAIMQAFKDSLSVSKDLLEAIDNISGGNVRRALDFVRGFFGSGHVDTQKIAEIYWSQGSYYVPLHEFLRAVIYGNAIYYDPLGSPIANLFEVSTNDPREHFLLPMALGVIGSMANASRSNGFLETPGLYEMLQNYGFTPVQIASSLSRAYEKRLVETAGRQDPSSEEIHPMSFRITTVGAYHIHRLINRFLYVDAVVIDTPILSEQHRKEIRDVSEIRERLDRAENFCNYLDEQWKHSHLKTDVFDWTEVSEAIRSDIRLIDNKYSRRMMQGSSSS